MGSRKHREHLQPVRSRRFTRTHRLLWIEERRWQYLTSYGSWAWRTSDPSQLYLPHRSHDRYGPQSLGWREGRESAREDCPTQIRRGNWHRWHRFLPPEQPIANDHRSRAPRRRRMDHPLTGLHNSASTNAYFTHQINCCQFMGPMHSCFRMVILESLFL